MSAWRSSFRLTATRTRRSASSAGGPTPRSIGAWPRAGRGSARSLSLLNSLERLTEHEGEAARAEEAVQGIGDPSPPGRAESPVEDHLDRAAAVVRACPQLEGRTGQQGVGVDHRRVYDPGLGPLVAGALPDEPCGSGPDLRGVDEARPPLVHRQMGL